MSDIPPPIYHIVSALGSAETQKIVQEGIDGDDGPSWKDEKVNVEYEQFTAAEAVEYFKKMVKEDERIAAGGFRSEPTIVDRKPRGRPAKSRPVRDVVRSYVEDVDDEEYSPRRAGTAPSTSGRRRGRPSKSATSAVAVASPNDDADSGDEAVPAKRGRGRPPTKKTGKSPGGASGSANGKKRGRPSKKVAKEVSDGSESDDSISEKNDDSGELQQEEEEADD